MCSTDGAGVAAKRLPTRQEGTEGRRKIIIWKMKDDDDDRKWMSNVASVSFSLSLLCCASSQLFSEAEVLDFVVARSLRSHPPPAIFNFFFWLEGRMEGGRKRVGMGREKDREGENEREGCRDDDDDEMKE